MGKVRYLILEDGSYFEGKAFGGDNFKIGKIISNTSMSGYQEILLDNKNSGKIVTLTYPMIGSYGITREGFENMNPYIFGIIVGEKTDGPSNWKSQMTLNEYLQIKNIPAIEGIDTRMLAKKIKKSGELKATFSDTIENLEDVVNELKISLLDENFIEKISVNKPFRISNNGDKILVIDNGCVEEILRELNCRDKDISVVPYNFSSEDILKVHSKGVIISDGPGNPELMTKQVENIKKLIGNIPLFGIGLGHQLISQALDIKVRRLKYSKRGGNYPVKNILTGKIKNVEMNNEFTLKKENLRKDVQITHIDVNSGDVEGIKLDSSFINSIQYKPVYFENEKIEEYETFYSNIAKFEISKKEKKNA